MNYSDLTTKIVEKAKQKGVQMAEAYLNYAKTLEIDISNQEIDTLSQAEEQGIGLRVINNGKLGFAFTTDLREDALDKVLAEAIANAQNTAADPYINLPGPQQTDFNLSLFDQKIKQVEIGEKIERAKSVERAALAKDKRVKRVRKVSYGDSEYTVAIANSLGLNVMFSGTYCSASAMVVAEDNGETQIGWSYDFSPDYDGLNVEKAGNEAAEKAVRMLGGKVIPSVKATVILDPQVAASFMGVLGPAFLADSVQKGKSFLKGKLDQTVMAPIVSIIDNGRLPRGMVTMPYDGEGISTREKELVKNGRLQGFLYNTYTAAKDNVKSTGNALRGSFKGTPEVGYSNFYIAPGQKSAEELIENVSEGLYITDVLGMHTANPVTGDFSVGAAGIWIKNGELTYPVRGVAIAGNILKVFGDIEDLANDIRFYGRCGSPTIRIASLAISGS